MQLQRAKDGLKRLHGRRWFKRMTYVLVSGALCVGGIRWTVRQPFFNRWLIDRLDRISFEQTGLHFQAKHIELHPFRNYLVVDGFSVGGDLLQADRLLLQADFLSLATSRPHIWNVELDNPHLEIDAERLSRIHLKPRKASTGSKDWFLDRCAVRGGLLNLHGAGWGAPNGEFAFRIYATGMGANQVQMDFRVPRLKLAQNQQVLNGAMSLLVIAGKNRQELKQGELRLERSSLNLKGVFEGMDAPCQGSLKADVELAPLMDFLLPSGKRMLAGQTRIEGGIAGTPRNPKWTVAVKGHDLESVSSGIRPASLDLKAQGTLQQVQVKDLAWDSSQGRLHARGGWRKGAGSELSFEADSVNLAPLGAYLHAPGIASMFFQGRGDAQLPGDPWKAPRLDAVEFNAKGQFFREGRSAGSLSASLAKGELQVDSLELDAPEAHVQGHGRLRLGAKGLLSVQAEGSASTDAEQVATALRSWKITDLDMSGQVQAQAQVAWSKAAGLTLKGHVDALDPRWHTAHGDQLRADVSIEGGNLRVQDIQLDRGKGHGSGELWLTWSGVAPGREEMDMCFQAFRLPIEEGMKASGLEADILRTLGITGIGSGWVRIHGPYDRIRLEGSAMAEDAEVCGLKIPFASGDMDLDLKGNRLLLGDIRVAEGPQFRGAQDEAPTGLLALQGNLDMDLGTSTWKGGLKGSMDSAALGLGGPRFQAQVDLGLNGPWAAHFGPSYLPAATLDIKGGRVFLADQSLEGLEGHIDTTSGGIAAQMGFGGMARPLAQLQVWPMGETLVGAADLHIGADSSDSAHLASRLSGDYMKGVALDAAVQGRWDSEGLRWDGALQNLVARFEGFDLVQPRACALSGNASRVGFDLGLQAQGLPAAEGPRNSGLMRVAGTLPFSLQQPLDVKVTGQAELANLKKILDGLLQLDSYSLLGGLSPKGKAMFNIGVGGTFAQPGLDGNLSLQQGSLEVRTYPQSIENLRFNLLFKGREILIPESDPLTGRIAQGNLQAWGGATWGFGGLQSYDIKTKLKDFQLRDFPGAEGFELQGSLDAQMQGSDEEGGHLQGTLLADRMSYRAEISLGNILASALGGSSLSVLKAPDETMSLIDLDLEVKLKEPWEVDTNLLKLQGRPVGSFRIQNTLAEPRLSGTMAILPGGRITNVLPAGDVVIEEGSIAFDPNQLLPFMAINGRIDISPYTVNLNLKGPADALKMTASATPSLRQEEILAILIDPSQASTLGSSMGAASMTQSAFSNGLAATSSGLLTTLALAEFQDRLRRSLHLDRVNVVWRSGSLGNSETEITVGKTINLFGLHMPLVGTHRKAGDVTTISGQGEWRFGNFVLQLGFSQTGSDKAGLAGEIRHTWIPFW